LGLRPGIAGVIVAEGSFLWRLLALYRKTAISSRPIACSVLKLEYHHSRDQVPEGKSECFVTSFTADKPGISPPAARAVYSSMANNKPKGNWNTTVPFRFASYAGMDIGTDNGLPVVPKFEYTKSATKVFQGHN